MWLAVGVALVFSLLALSRGLLKPVRNPWLFIIMGYLFLSVYLAPKTIIELNGVDIKNAWSWFPMFNIMVFFLFFLSVASVEFNKELILKVMVYAGSVMAGYVILQYFGFDQFFVSADPGLGRLGGTLGNRAITSAYIAMIIPIALYFKKYLLSLLMVISIFMMGISASIVSMIAASSFFIWSCLRWCNRRIFILFMVASALISGFVIFKMPNKEIIANHGRYQVWRELVEDLRKPVSGKTNKKYSFTGFGIGSFKYMFHAKHPVSNFTEAHNDYLELLYNIGVFGLFLFLASMWRAAKKSFIPENRYRMMLLSSFGCVALNAGGLFCWQSAPIVFNSLIILGLMQKEEGYDN